MKPTSEIAETASSYDMSIHSNPDPASWAKFFRECNPDCNVPDDVVFGWFANAMMAMHDHLHSNRAIKEIEHSERVEAALARSIPGSTLKIRLPEGY